MFSKLKQITKFHPYHFTSENGIDMIAFSDKEKSEVLNQYFSSISNIDDTSHNLMRNIPYATTVSVTFL
jgi:hypothetical protein